MRTFRPLPLLGNPHLQTLVASLVSLAREPVSTREAVILADGDRIALEITTPADWDPGRGTVVLVHGLSGDHRSSYMRRIAAKLARRGVRAVRYNMRDAGSGEGWAKRPYHGGLSDDLRAAIEQVARAGGPIDVWGFSLGGNVALKLAGELGADGPELVRSVYAVCPAVDLPRCVDRIMRPENRIYEWGFLRELKAMAERRFERYPDVERIEIPEKLRIKEFDDLYIAQIWGFGSADRYYEEASARPYVPEIRVRARILMSDDDPIICPDVLTRRELPAQVNLVRLGRGGHLGFLGPAGGHGVQWMDRILFRWYQEFE